MLIATTIPLIFEAFKIRVDNLPKRIGHYDFTQRPHPILVATHPTDKNAGQHDHKGEIAQLEHLRNPFPVQSVFLVDTSRSVDNSESLITGALDQSVRGLGLSNSEKVSIVTHNGNGAELHEVTTSELDNFIIHLQFNGAPNFREAVDIVSNRILQNAASKRILLTSIHSQGISPDSFDSFNAIASQIAGGYMVGLNQLDGSIHDLHRLAFQNANFGFRSLAGNKSNSLVTDITTLRGMLARVESQARFSIASPGSLFFSGRPSFSKLNAALDGSFPFGFRETNMALGFLPDSTLLPSTQLQVGNNSLNGKVEIMGQPEYQEPANKALGNLLCYLCFIERDGEALREVLDNFEIDLKPIGSPTTEALIASLKEEQTGEDSYYLFEKALSYFANRANKINTPEEVREEIARSRASHVPQVTSPGSESSIQVLITPINLAPINISNSLARGFIIGRDHDCNLRPTVEEVSKKHCRIYLNGDAVMIEDLKSRNGTSVNRVKITEPKVLQTGDIVNAGGYIFTINIAQPKPAKADRYSGLIAPGTGQLSSTNYIVMVPGDTQASDELSALNIAECLSDEKRCVIGSNPTCDKTINLRGISSRHCELYEKDGKLYVIDCGVQILDMMTLNGVFVNGSQILTEKELKNGDTLSLDAKDKYSYTIAIGSREKSISDVIDVAVNGDKKLEKLELPGVKSTLVLGRGRSAADIKFNSQYASRRHAEIRNKAGIFFLVDLNSLNGTYLNGVKIAKGENRIYSGDIITICGESKIVNIEGCTGRPINANDSDSEHSRMLRVEELQLLQLAIQRRQDAHSTQSVNCPHIEITSTDPKITISKGLNECLKIPGYINIGTSKTESQIIVSDGTLDPLECKICSTVDGRVIIMDTDSDTPLYVNGRMAFQRELRGHSRINIGGHEFIVSIEGEKNDPRTIPDFSLEARGYSLLCDDPLIFDKEEITIGFKNHGADLGLNHGRVSPRHCKITRSENHRFLEDSGSTYGTFINGQEVHQGAKILLRNNDVIKVGDQIDSPELLVKIKDGHENPPALKSATGVIRRWLRWRPW